MTEAVYQGWLEKLYVIKIERALNIKLFDNVKLYILGKEVPDSFYHDRRTVSTTALIIKLALSEGEPLNILNDPQKYADYPYTRVYAQNYFRHRFMDIWTALSNAGLEVRPIIPKNRKI